MRFNTEEDKIRVLASQISVLLLDVDGVLTDGKLLFSSSGEELKAFCSLDGHGIKMLLRTGVQVGIITGRTSIIVENRCRDLGITLVLQGQKDKAAALNSILAAQNIGPQRVAYVGDDLPDWPVLEQVGLSFSVPSDTRLLPNEWLPLLIFPQAEGPSERSATFCLRRGVARQIICLNFVPQHWFHLGVPSPFHDNLFIRVTTARAMHDLYLSDDYRLSGVLYIFPPIVQTGGK